MKVALFPCGPAATESEHKAFEHLRTRLQTSPGDDEWVLLTNLAFSVTHQLQSDEIDIVSIGPPGVRVIEVKHWTAEWVDANPDLVEQEAEKVTNKARKIGTTLRRFVPELPRVDGVILLTREPSKVKRLSDHTVRGVCFFTLGNWKELLQFERPAELQPLQIRKLARIMEPKSAVAMEGSLQRFAGYVNLKLQTPKDERFHRIYKGSHSVRQDRVILHLYDLTAGEEKTAESRAKREFEALHRLQLNAWAPRILDSYQDAPGYPGEMFFFTVIDPSAPSIKDRARDHSWDSTARIDFARKAISALAELHEMSSDKAVIVHRNLSPNSILVKHDNSPVLTGFDQAKIPSNVSVASSVQPPWGWEATVAPEVRTRGLAAADHRSDVFSLCSSLRILFQKKDEISQRVLKVLKEGSKEQAEQRASLGDLQKAFSELLGESLPAPNPPPARFWTEDQIVRFRDRDYRIVSRLGSGGVGMTFKVVEIDRSTKEDLGVYVAKVVHNKESGQRVLNAYSLVRSHLGRHGGLSAIFEVAHEWRKNDFMALMSWIEGSPLGEFTGVFPLLAEDQQEESAQTLAMRWLGDMCEALGNLHRNGLVHGDVSPSNMIVSGGDIVLTDYDFVAKVGESIDAPGTVLYSSKSDHDRRASRSDDIYALAASFFHVVFEREPFLYDGTRAKERGLNWSDLDQKEYPRLFEFLDKATHRDPTQRFLSVAEALEALKRTESRREETESKGPSHSDKEKETQALPREERVEWLLSLMQSYAGSLRGNVETRGLDTEFATQTYVETNLEESLLSDIRGRRVRLVILCGNAGDGKTALLQHLASRLGLGERLSSERILEGQINDGLIIRMNLDGSAAWRGRSADEILDEFLGPFKGGQPSEDIVHLLAINDGRLLEWIETVESLPGGYGTPLTRDLYNMLQGGTDAQDSFIRFINLNQRSLVGAITQDRRRIETSFLERLLDHLYGGEHACARWSPCQSCLARDRCEVVRAARIFGPKGLPGQADDKIRNHARKRLFQALQAVHLRGETHITVRELRATLVYILFGIHFCDDYHGVSEIPILPYWDRAFAPDSPSRQGDALRELARFDPALEAHPQIDRHLMSQPSLDSTKKAPRWDDLGLDSARRRAYFEWTAEHIEEIAGGPLCLDLARGKHLRLFRDLALEMDPQERAELSGRLCGGISRLEDLPPQALDRTGVVPLRITPRTPTETSFWVEKPLSAFRLEADLPPATEGVDRLHRQALLIYQYRDGREECLRLGSELFHVLLELYEGYQLGDVSTDDTFAHLSIFVQRLAQEDERELLTWNPIQDEAIFRVSARIEHTLDCITQRIVLSQVTHGGHP